jgi:hypothetical protein
MHVNENIQTGLLWTERERERERERGRERPACNQAGLTILEDMGLLWIPFFFFSFCFYGAIKAGLTILVDVGLLWIPFFFFAFFYSVQSRQASRSLRTWASCGFQLKRTGA